MRPDRAALAAIARPYVSTTRATLRLCPSAATSRYEQLHCQWTEAPNQLSLDYGVRGVVVAYSKPQTTRRDSAFTEPEFRAAEPANPWGIRRSVEQTQKDGVAKTNPTEPNRPGRRVLLRRDDGANGGLGGVAGRRLEDPMCFTPLPLPGDDPPPTPARSALPLSLVCVSWSCVTVSAPVEALPTGRRARRKFNSTYEEGGIGV